MASKKHQLHDCLLNRLFKAQIKENIGEFPTQKASNMEKVFIWWSHHGGSAALKWKYPMVITYGDYA